MENPLIWAAFIVFILLMLALDLGIFHRQAHAVKFREAAAWSLVWIAMALIFNAMVYATMGTDLALQFLTGYVIEKSLSVDNIFVFLMIFSYFHVPAEYQHRVLIFGVLGALVMRAIFITAGIALLEAFHWIVYLFGAFLIITGINVSRHKDKRIEPERNPVVRLARRVLPMTDRYHGQNLFTRVSGRMMATPLFLVIMVIETTDLIFAVDSIPAILAVSREPFIVFTSNVFAIMGLRALYFCVAGLLTMFHFIHYALTGILVFVGAKMLLMDIYRIPTAVSLGVVLALLVLAVLASIKWPQKADETERLLAGEADGGPAA